MTIRFHTHVTIGEPARQEIISGLNAILAATLDLGSQVKQAHWNVRGEQFFARHTMFDSLYSHLVASADTVAERIGQLGGYAEGTVRQAAATSSLPEHDLAAVQGREHVLSLTARYGELGALLRAHLQTADGLKEPVTVDLYTEVLRGLEMDLWFLESHLERGQGATDTKAEAAPKRANGPKSADPRRETP